jgi:hypothetical protein
VGLGHQQSEERGAARPGQEFAFAHGLDQSGFSKMLAIYANRQLAEAAHFNQARRAEIEKLGSAAAARVDAMNMFLESQLGSELAGALRKTMFTADSVRAVERLMRNYVSQGVYASPGAARDGAHGRGPEKLSDEAYGKLSYHQKIQYAEDYQRGGGR